MGTAAPGQDAHAPLRRLLAYADAQLAAGDFPTASEAYRKALALRPDCADAWFNLGFALRRQGEFVPALDAYARALHARVAQPEVAHLNRAAIYSDHLRDDAAALTELDAALRLAPDLAPALLNLGNLHEERGERDAASACYLRLIGTATPKDGGLVCQALARMVQLAPPTSMEDPLLARLRAVAFGEASIDDGDRATALFAFGRACDGLGAHGAAFDAFARGKQHAHHRHPPYDPGRASRLTDALIVTAPRSVPLPSTAPRLPQPLFICGMFRSGSTLVEQVLAAHPQVAAGGELELLPRMVAGPLAPFPESLPGLDVDRSRVLAAGYAEALALKFPGLGPAIRYLTDKRPDNYRLIGLIKRLFPDARIINTVRDPRDNALAIFMQHLNPRAFPYAASLESIAHQYGEYRRLLAHWKSLYPGDVHDFDYDAFVAAPAHTLQSLLSFLDLPWHEGCLSFHAVTGTVKTASHWQVRRPLYAEASGRWRRYHTWLAPLLSSLNAQGLVTRAEDQA